jgi:predicted oxidoreductase
MSADDLVLPVSGLPARVPQVQSGDAVFSRVVAGAWRMVEWARSAQDHVRWIEGCVSLGMTTFDHADVYGSYRAEEVFGQAMALSPGLRQQLQLVTKCGIRLVSPQRPAHRIKHYDTSAAHVVASVESSLRALRTDYLDVLLIHRPDALLDADEFARCADDLRQAGKVRHVGVSNFSVSQFNLLHARTRLVTNQIQWSPLHLQPLEDGTLDQAQMLGIRPMIWSPLAGGRLFDTTDPVARRVHDELAALARDWDTDVTTVACAWLLRHPSGVVPVLGSRRLAAMQQAAAACHLQFPAEDWYRVWRAAKGHDVA